jgi:acetylornithine deacetylase/succinyl-diaminopimelate desuccinylase-like protein
MQEVAALKSLFNKYKAELLEDYKALLRIPSISADPAYSKEVLKAAAWIETYLKESGLKVEVWDTPHYPVIFGSWLEAGPNRPTLLLYGHYDVQPVDPLDEWDTPPFEPSEREGKIYARGAQDNKGQLLYTLCAIRALLKRDGKLPLNLKITIEGEEETKSTGFIQILASKAAQLKADYFVSPDFDIPALDRPAVTLGLRGLVALTVELRGSKLDPHSGSHGGMVFNPNHALIELLSKLRDEQGRVTLSGFYDDIAPLSTEERKLLSIEIDEKSYSQEFGAALTGGERQFTPGERRVLRPTLEINGIHGGYGGPGFKTVIPAKALAKISCRLVPGQNPEKIRRSLTHFLEKHCPPGIKLTLVDHGGDPAVWSSPKTPLAQALAKAYTEVFQTPCGFTLAGGSVPISEALAKTAQAAPAFMGVGLLGDQIHAPNEHFDIFRLELGFLTLARFIQLIGVA